MDFKVAGTAQGITALQMDIKVTGITSEIMAKALEQARAGRMHILGEMAKTLARRARQHVDVRAAHHHHQDPGRQDPRRHRPRRQDDPQHHRADRREDRRRGRRHASTWRRPTANRRPKAIGIIQELTATPELNKTYMGKVQRITDFGAFVEIMAGHRRPAARVRDREPPREGRARRAEGRPADPGEGHQHRPDRQDSAEPQGAAAGRGAEGAGTGACRRESS